MPVAVFALAAGAFGIGTTEFVIMGLLLQVSDDLGVSVSAAGLLISGYALGVFVGAPLLTIATRRLPRKTVLLALMLIFTIGNVACALAPNYAALMAARVLTALAHGTFFGVGSVVATQLVAPERRASAIAAMFTGLTLATLLGVPAGSWLGLAFGWRATFWAVALIGVAAVAVLAWLVPAIRNESESVSLRAEARVLLRPQVQLGLAMTVLGFAGVFAAVTYLQPMLTQLGGFPMAQVSPILLLFGLGFLVGNTLGGRYADRGLLPTLIVSLLLLSLVLGAMTEAMHHKIPAIVAVGLLGAAAFATVSPLQLYVLDKAGAAGRNLVSSLNIAAFNLGNALGAWAGGLTIDHGPGLPAVPIVAAVLSAAGLGLCLWSRQLDRRSPMPATACRS